MASIRVVSGAFTPFLVMPGIPGSTSKFVLKSVAAVGDIALKILTKWGATIYESENYDNNWDGATASAGTYYYQASVSSNAFPFTGPCGGWIVVIKD